MAFDARSSSGPVSVPFAGLPMGHVPPRLLGKVGEEFASSLAVLQDRLGALEHHPGVSACMGEIERLERLGLQLQQVARVLGHDGAGNLEPVDLGEAVRQVVSGWAPRAAAREVTMLLPDDNTPIQAEVNAPVLEQLLDLCMAYAVDVGQGLGVRVQRDRLSCQTLLQIDIQRATPVPVAIGVRIDDSEFDRLAWLLLTQLARASGVIARRMVSASRIGITLVFPQVGNTRWSDAQPSPAELPTTPVARWCQVLVVDPHSRSRLLARELLAAVGMRVDVVATLEQARQALRDIDPDVLVTGLPSNDSEACRFVEELRARMPHLGVIELVDMPDAFALSGLDTPGRVSRADMVATLVMAVSQEVGAAQVLV